jgi:branched-chain amino acid transport system permease protein
MRSRIILGAVVVLALVLAPAVLSSSLINAGIQMLIASLFACAFCLLCGQAGMLSFGHSAFFGVGAFATVHAMNALGGAGLVPTPFMPLVGAVTGLLVGLVAGWFATKRTGVYFAMITLAIGELLYSLAPHLSGWFGGEAGVSTMRMPAFGLSFGSNVQVYYLTLAWVLLCLCLLFLFTRTPLGRVALGLRENTRRLRFLGYNVHVASVLVFAVSTMFAGVAGALQAINIESANYVLFNLDLSAEVLLNSYIGGVTFFIGPAIGAALMTFFGYVVSDLTTSWLLYKGLLFVVVMLFIPRGIAGLVQTVAGSVRRCGLGALAAAFVLYGSATVLLIAGTVFSVEMLQRIFSQDYLSMAQVGGRQWPPVPLFGASWPPLSLTTWLVPVALFVVGLLVLRQAVRRWRTAIETAAQASDDADTGALTSGASS